MSKVIQQEIKDLGFTAELLNFKEENAYFYLLDEIIAEQALLLEGRLGSTVYASTTSPTQDYIKRAEKCFVAAEVVQRRINVILGNVIGAGNEINISHEVAQKKAYLDEAESLLVKISAGITTDDQGGGYAGGVLVTSHFASTSSINGLE